MKKHKRGDFNSNQMMQWVLIGLIVIIVFKLLDINIWAFWWIPFAFYWASQCWGGWSHHHDDDSKSKNDDIDYV